jgi:hypothetical protein
MIALSYALELGHAVVEAFSAWNVCTHVPNKKESLLLLLLDAYWC